MKLTTRNSLADMARKLHDGELSATQAVRAALDRIEETDGQIRAWVVVDARGALAEAARLDAIPAGERQALHGIPIGVKDIIDVRGLPTRCGSVLGGSSPAAEDAAIVAQLRELGAIMLGKTVTTEYAYFNPGPTGNPHDIRRTPGGSSSGSAAAVAAGMVPLALGTQTAASVIRPAAYCGVTGHVAAQGAFPDAGITGLSPSFDAMGFLTDSVADMQFLREALGISGGNTTSRSRFILWNPESPFGVAPTMSRALAAIAERLERVSTITASTEVSVGSNGEGVQSTAAHLATAHATIMAYEAVRLRAREAARSEELSPQLAALFAEGRTIGESEYSQATSLVDENRHAFRALLQDGSVLLAPAAQSIAPEGLEATGSPLLSRPWQALGFPVVVVAGIRDDETGMPLGIQLVGVPGEEDTLFAAAAILESVL